MLIAQITDLHIGFDAEDADELNVLRARAVLATVADTQPRPDLVLCSGDMTDGGDPAAYRRLRALLDAAPFPVFPSVGNHDDRAAFADAFPDAMAADGFAQYAIEGLPVRVLVLDTLEEGRHGGGFCETRARWLDARLAERPDRPTLVMAHHPPIPSGLAWMTAGADERWVLRLTDALSRHRQVVAVISGHLHRAMFTMLGATPLVVAPSVAPQVALDLTEIDPERPDGRVMVVAEPPGYMLHRWDGERLVSHVGMVTDAPVLARYDARLQPLVRRVFAEREEDAAAPAR